MNDAKKSGKEGNQEGGTSGGHDYEGRADYGDPSGGQAVLQLNRQSAAPEGGECGLPDSAVFGEVIFAYTRKQAIEDGVLVDVTETAKEAGFKIPVALTRA